MTPCTNSIVVLAVLGLGCNTGAFAAGATARQALQSRETTASTDAPVMKTLGTIIDPCDAANAPAPGVLARCAARGVPANVNSMNELGNVTQAGNPRLPQISEPVLGRRPDDADRR